MRRSQEAEYSEFVTANLVPLRRFGYLVCGDWHRAEDAVQTVFVKLYVDWNRANRRSPVAYAQRMVVNALNDVHRRAWFQREQLKEELPETFAPLDSDASDRRIVVLDALAKLPTRRRATLVLRFWADHSVEQTAEIMGCSAATVKSQTSRGLKSLRELLPNPLHESLEGITP
ncbi:SigE family RNA polymerase sigma factor [Stackebrandtia soli]|uniref:SigE family RNA polymerase sigma factor n=1 Tax=Stackebrandtia soli TaxID=1892856 RepID=UPI0039E76B4D